MRKVLLSAGIAMGLMVPVLTSSTAAATDDAAIDIPFTRYTLDNGLTLLVHEDHKAPIVAVNVWYHVGSKNEKVGKTGFAHLFEHLMFNGSENYNDDYFKPFDRVGATGMNGTTNADRTNYFEVVPTTALDLALWMESDRMGHLLGAIDQARLDEQRGVVQNEKRQGENQPYGIDFDLITKATYGAGHPYHHTTIGEMEDLDAASLDDVKQWFKDYYGAANAVVAVAGDIDPEEVHQKVIRYFGDIPSGPPVQRMMAWTAKRTGEQRESVQERVPQAKLYMAWNIPPKCSPEADALNVASEIFGHGKNSRLYRRLVYKDQIATDVDAYLWDRELGSLFIVEATAQPGEDLSAIESAVREELAKFLADGPSADELARVQTSMRADFIRGVERVGGFGGKSDVLASGQVYCGDPTYYKTYLSRVAAATPQQLQSLAQRWLSDGTYVLDVRPFPAYGTEASDVDRSKLPEATDFPTVHFAHVEKAQLTNGLKVLLARRSSIPVIDFELLVDAGYAADQFAEPGTADLALNMMDEGTTSRTSQQISEEAARLGAEIDTDSNLDMSSVTLSALKENLDASLDLFADVALHPNFPEADFERLQKEQLATIEREKATPVQMGLRVLPQLLYGKDHAYGLPFTGSGYADSVKKISREDLAKFHSTWFKPNNATLVVVGDTTMTELKPKLEAVFGKWKPGDAPKKNISHVGDQGHSVVYLLDRPGSQQSVILASELAPPKANPEEVAIEAMNQVLGGAFTARINMNLREDKHWSYGARTLIVDAEGQRPFLVYAPVQTDKTSESMHEIDKELKDIRGDRPPTADEVAKAKDQRTLTLPGRWETNEAVLNSIVEMVRFGLPDDYWDTYSSRVRGLSDAQVENAAQSVVQPGRLIWVVVGDREKIEPGIRALNLGPVEALDADGNPIASD